MRSPHARTAVRGRAARLMLAAAAAPALLAGPAAAALAAPAGPAASAAAAALLGPMTPALAARLSRDVSRPVIVVMKQQFGGGPAARAAAAAASQRPVTSELADVHATGLRSLSLVNAVTATVSPGEETRLAASARVAEVVPDVTIQGAAPAEAVPAAPAEAVPAAPAAAARARADA
jgi:hypothetical protein